MIPPQPLKKKLQKDNDNINQSKKEKSIEDKKHTEEIERVSGKPIDDMIFGKDILKIKKISQKAKANIEKANKEKCPETIWDYKILGDGETKKIFSHSKCAYALMQRDHFLSLGEEKIKIYHYKNGCYYPRGKQHINQTVQTWTIGENISTNAIMEVRGHIERSNYKESSILNDLDPYKICVGNGVLDLKTKQLTPHNPEEAHFQKIDIFYNPEAKIDKIKTFFNQVIEKEEDVLTMQEFLGFCLVKKYIQKKALIMVGEPDTGKTTILKLILKFIGADNHSNESIHNLTQSNFAPYNLMHKLLNIYDDLPDQDLKDVGTFKILTGDGYSRAEQKFQDSLSFRNYAKMIFATNKISDIKNSDDEAYYRRWLLIFFNNIIPRENQNDNLVSEISTKEEMQGLLNWAIKGYDRLIENKRFSNEKHPDIIKAMMERSSNPISAFIQDCLEEQPGNHILKEEMYSFYIKYLIKYPSARVGIKKFGKQLQDKTGYIVDSRKKINSKVERSWENVIFKKEMYDKLIKKEVDDLNDNKSTLLKYKNTNSLSKINMGCKQSFKSYTSDVKDTQKVNDNNKKKVDIIHTPYILDFLIDYAVDEVSFEALFENGKLKYSNLLKEDLEVWIKHNVETGVLFEVKPGRYKKF